MKSVNTARFELVFQSLGIAGPLSSMKGGEEWELIQQLVDCERLSKKFCSVISFKFFS